MDQRITHLNFLLKHFQEMSWNLVLHVPIECFNLAGMPTAAAVSCCENVSGRLPVAAEAYGA